MPDSNNNFTSNNITPISIDTNPNPTTRYFEIILYAVVVTIGLPMNLLALRHYVSVLCGKRHSSWNRFTLLKLNLNVSNLILLLIALPHQIVWLVTHYWLVGDTLCRILKFCSAFSYYASSNVVVVIAVDRVITILNVSPQIITTTKTPLMLVIAWTTSLLYSIPQMFLWTARVIPNDTHVQCSTVWLFKRHSMVPVMMDRLGEEKAYQLFHLIAVFWLPLAIISGCYAMIIKKLMNRSKKTLVRQPTRAKVVESTTRTIRRCSSMSEQLLFFAYWIINPISQTSRMSRSNSETIHEVKELIMTNDNTVDGKNALVRLPLSPQISNPLPRAPLLTYNSEPAVMSSQYNEHPTPTHQRPNGNAIVSDQSRSPFIGTRKFLKKSSIQRTSEPTIPGIKLDNNPADTDMDNDGLVNPGYSSKRNSSPLPSGSCCNSTTGSGHLDRKGWIHKLGSSVSLLRRQRSSVETSCLHGGSNDNNVNGGNGGNSSVRSKASNSARSLFRSQTEFFKSRNSVALATIQYASYRKTVLILSMYILCWGPYNIIAIIEFIDKNLIDSIGPHLGVLEGLIALNAVVNPILYKLNMR